ncbi:prolyl oligopeptidase family protein [Bacteroidota bacterium]
MKRIIYLFILAGIVSCTQTNQKKQRLDYPVTAKVDTVDVYFGTEVPDPYRWLEDDMSDETGEWVKAQNKVTDAFLEQIPFRNKIEERLTELWDYPKISSPFKRGPFYFIYKNDGLQNQNVIYIKKTIDAEEELFLDPNTFSEDGTISLTNFSVSKDGKYFVYGISDGGSDWREFFVIDMETGNKLDDHIEWVKFSGAYWYKDGFFYSTYPKPADGDKLKGENINSKVYYHKVGTEQIEDKLIYEMPELPNRGFYAYVTRDEKYLILSASESTTGNMLYFKSLENENAEFMNLVDNFENDYSVIDHYEGKLYVLTNYEAPKYKLIGIDVEKYENGNWIDIIPEQESVLQSVSVTGMKLFADLMQDAHTVIKAYQMNGSYLYDVDLPVIGSAGGFGGDIEDEFTFYSVTSFTTPSTVYKYDITENTSEVYTESQIDFDTQGYTTEQVFFESKDGTKVPMFITYKSGLKRNGKNPTLLYGYGGFNISLTPYFSVTRLIWLENGGIFALVNLRGGGEYGEEWHEAGTKLQKQNVFDDFISAAEYLVSEKYTSSKRITIQGGSNGGLLVGAVTNQRPDLFAVALPAVGVMDMLRYHKFTIGRYWAADYGTSEDSEEMFKYLYNYSPLHSCKENVEYPAVLVTTADHDDRVVPAHSFKYISQLQETYKGNSPVLIRIATKAGHGAGKPTSKIIEEYADLWSFAFYNMNFAPKY